MDNKIDLKAILARRIIKFPEGLKDTPEEHMTNEAIQKNVLAAMKEVWDTAVDECKKEVKVKIRKLGIGSYSQTKDSFSKYDLKDAISASIDEDSIEQVKQMIL